MSDKVRICAGCGVEIPAARLAALPNTCWCVVCAETKVKRVGGLVVWTGKHTPELHVLPTIKQAGQEWKRSDRRGATANLRFSGQTNPFEAED